MSLGHTVTLPKNVAVECGVCKRKFVNQRYLQMHMKTHQNTPPEIRESVRRNVEINTSTMADGDVGTESEEGESIRTSEELTQNILKRHLAMTLGHHTANDVAKRLHVSVDQMESENVVEQQQRPPPLNSEEDADVDDIPQSHIPTLDSDKVRCSILHLQENDIWFMRCCFVYTDVPSVGKCSPRKVHSIVIL